MSRILVFSFMLIGFWVGITLYTEGSDRAFGGMFARFRNSTALDAPATRSTQDRAVDAYQRAWNTSEGRVDRQLSESPEIWERPDPDER